MQADSLSLSLSLSLVQECLRLIGQDTAEKGEDEHSSFNQILRIKAVHFLAFFILVYVGVEVTIGGRGSFSTVLHLRRS